MEKKYWGYHLVLNVCGCDIETFTVQNIRNFFHELIKRIDMIPFGDVEINYLCADDEEKKGYTASQIITTSNIMAHFVDKDGVCYFDIFSCKEFDDEIAYETIKKYFNPKTLCGMLLGRDKERVQIIK